MMRENNELNFDLNIKGSEVRHRHSMDKWITIGGFILIFLFGLGEFVLVVVNKNSEWIKEFFSHAGSASMLILGYLFGSRKQ